MKALPPASSRIKVLVADDHVTVREGLAAIIGRQADMEVVGEAVNGLEAVEVWKKARPDVALVDLRMPVLDGTEAIRRIRALDPGAKVIVLTTFETDNDILNSIKAGAKAYLLKDTGREEILDTLRRVHRGETCLSPGMIGRIAEGFSGPHLTDRETEVLKLLAEGCSNKEMAGRLFISETTVKSHLRSIFGKFGVLSRTEAVAVASRRGLIQI